ncbi:hypothetical protein H2O64_04140 [Kordia sp. YSTF-M3]|uniref:Uncharacterized protein n=1 Tax=Kordia aestuariivivens TaxID=2759037 RepID=A0ABR7Q673_9FLAO|nr:hypothetical protein [Kordia aestuariivivens]MBC8753846.1 hypothetical protein [Kordia aestuariivivens]
MTHDISALEYFLSITISLLLLYNFLTTVLFCFQKELLTENKSVRIFQRLLLVIILLAMFVYVFNTENIPSELTELYVLPWIWGFLASHIFIIRKKRWFNELLGLGVLLAITIVIFFKQEDLIQEKNSSVYFLYLILGVLLGGVFWPTVKNDI